jgi:hypothetical protein
MLLFDDFLQELNFVDSGIELVHQCGYFTFVVADDVIWEEDHSTLLLGHA